MLNNDCDDNNKGNWFPRNPTVLLSFAAWTDPFFSVFLQKFPQSSYYSMSESRGAESISVPRLTKSLKNPINNLTNSNLTSVWPSGKTVKMLVMLSLNFVLNTVQVEVVVFVKSPYKENLHHRWPRQK